MDKTPLELTGLPEDPAEPTSPLRRQVLTNLSPSDSLLFGDGRVDTSHFVRAAVELSVAKGYVDPELVDAFVEGDARLEEILTPRARIYAERLRQLGGSATKPNLE